MTRLFILKLRVFLCFQTHTMYMKNMKRPPGLFSRRSFIQFLQHILLRLQNHFAGAAAEEASVFQYRMPVHINVDNAAGFKVRLFLIDP